jgi:hypothetical protein
MPYKARYGAWAGSPEGRPADLSRCCEEVTPNERGGFAHRHQCIRPRGHGPDKEYCKQHDPERVSARQAERERAWKDRTNKERYQWHGREFFGALQKIADGHNDARGLAQDVIAKFHEGAYK